MLRMAVSAQRIMTHILYHMFWFICLNNKKCLSNSSNTALEHMKTAQLYNVIKWIFHIGSVTGPRPVVLA